MRLYDKKKKQLVYIQEKATPDFWDRQWEDATLKKTILAGKKERFVFPITKRYLDTGSKILEGGFGKGQYVYSLYARGYDAYGVDFAEKTVQKVSALFPELKLYKGDVRKLDFPDNTFDGYWSLGVIEHFPEGYQTIAEEMHRVLKVGGYLFLTFPYMSPLRKFKAYLGIYPPFNEQHFDREHFYQFALEHTSALKNFERLGFKTVQKIPYEGFKGLKDEMGSLKPFFQKIYNNKSFPAQVFCYALSILFARFSGHAILLILRKEDSV